MNYMEQVAHMLGVELGEEFSINDSRNCIYKFTINGLFWRCQGYWLPSDISFTNILCGKTKIIKKPILDDAEKEYLTNVIKPFRDKISYICKSQTVISKSEWIRLVLKADLCIEFPCFENGTMYKGMEVGKKYTLEELGL